MSKIWKCKCGVKRKTADNVVLTPPCKECGGSFEKIKRINDGNTGMRARPGRWMDMESPYPCRECADGAMMCTSYNGDIMPPSSKHQCDKCGFEDIRSNHPNSDMPSRGTFAKEHRFVLENPNRQDFSVENTVNRLTRLLFENYKASYEELSGDKLLEDQKFGELPHPVWRLWSEFAEGMMKAVPELRKDTLTEREKDLLYSVIKVRANSLREDGDDVSVSIADDIEDIIPKLNL